MQTGNRQLGLKRVYWKQKKPQALQGEITLGTWKKILRIPFPKEGGVMTTTLTKQSNAGQQVLAA